MKPMVLGAGAALVLVATGCAVPRSPDDAARQAWLEQATALAHPHVEAAVGFRFQAPLVRWTGRVTNRGACATARYRGSALTVTEYYATCGKRSSAWWLSVVVHELVHVASFARRGGIDAGEHDSWWQARFREAWRGTWRFHALRTLPSFPAMNPSEALP